MTNIIILGTIIAITVILMAIGGYIEHKKQYIKNESIIKNKYDRLILNHSKLENEIYAIAHNCLILNNICINKDTYNVMDLLILDKSGIYCIKYIDTKDNIIGDFKSNKLTQYSLVDKTKFKIDNPIIENEKNVNTLKQLLNEDNIYNCVIFKNYFNLSNFEISEHFIVGSEEEFLKKFGFMVVNNNIFSKRAIKKLKNKIIA